MAAGRGTRLGADRPKALVPLGHGPDAAPLVTHALRGVLSCPDLSDVVVVGPPDRMPELTSALALADPGLARVEPAGVEPAGIAPAGVEPAGIAPAGVGPAGIAHGGQVRVTADAGGAERGGQVRVTAVAGGAERSDSVAAGLAALPPEVGIVLVHDAARALTPAAVFERVVAAVRHGHPAVTPAMPVTDTIKEVDARGQVVATPERSGLRAVQTPQGFLRETLERAHASAGGTVTDDAGLVEGQGGAVFVVEGDPRALKVTGPEDLVRARAMLGPPERAGRDVPPVLLVLGGLPGTGKTTLARAWAAARGAAHVRVDTIEQAFQRSGASLAGPEGYAVAYDLAADQLRLGLDVVADSVNPLPETRRAWRAAAAGVAADVFEVEVTCAPTEHRRRVQTREADIPGHRLPDWAAVQGSDAEPWTDADLTLDTSTTPAAELVRLIEDALRTTPGHRSAKPSW